jgi:hypothetical protein
MQKLEWNYKASGQRVRRKQRRQWKQQFEADTGIKLLNLSKRIRIIPFQD